MTGFVLFLTSRTMSVVVDGESSDSARVLSFSSTLTTCPPKFLQAHIYACLPTIASYIVKYT